MSSIKWYPRDPNAALAGMANLTFEEKGAYSVILDLIYMHAGKCPDSGKYIAHWIGIDTRRWLRLRKRLIEKGKIYPYAGELHNERADIEIHKIQIKVQLATEAANKRWADYNEIKKLADADAMRRQCNPRIRKESLSATIVPIPKRTIEKDDKS